MGQCSFLMRIAPPPAYTHPAPTKRYIAKQDSPSIGFHLQWTWITNKIHTIQYTHQQCIKHGKESEKGDSTNISHRVFIPSFTTAFRKHNASSTWAETSCPFDLGFDPHAHLTSMDFSGVFSLFHVGASMRKVYFSKASYLVVQVQSRYAHNSFVLCIWRQAVNFFGHFLNT